MISPAIFTVIGLNVLNFLQTPDPNYKHDCYLEIVTEFSGENHTFLGIAESGDVPMYMMGEGETLTINCNLVGMDCWVGSAEYTFLDIDEKRIDTGGVFILRTSGYYQFGNIYGGSKYIDLTVIPNLPFNILNFRVDKTQNELSFIAISSENSTQFHYDIYNLSGIEILNGEGDMYLGENIYRLNFSGNPPGIYIIKFIKENNTMSFKFII